MVATDDIDLNRLHSNFQNYHMNYHMADISGLGLLYS
jgi:hypothetical protein